LSTPVSAAAAVALGERGLIARIRARLPEAPPWLLVGPGDDAAVAAPERGALEILTTDALVEGVHFDWRFSSPPDVGWKALAVNVSDVASMGGAPRLALLSLAVPETLALDALDGMLDGFLAMAADARVAIAGGNITRSPGPLVVDVTVTGFVRPRRILTRAGARPGDAIYVTGEVGAAAAGLGWLAASARRAPALERADAVMSPRDPGERACIERYRRPEPRARIGALAGRNRAASACMDLSDGLADAITQIAAASGVGAVIEADALPIPAAAVRLFESSGVDPILAALAGGDDYELVFGVSRRMRGRFATVMRQARGVPLTQIGEFTRGGGVRLSRAGAEHPVPAGFVHF
jgi:thiamine-monophosphate kinase